MASVGISLAKSAYSAFNREKPRSSITEWVEILTSPNYEDEAYDGIPELVDSINLQPVVGPTEASRAIRKKLKHGNAQQQYRALVILKALVENCGQKFQNTFADSMLTDAIKHLGTDAGTDPRVKKKLLSVLASWNQQFKDDPSMALVANLYKQVRPERERPKSVSVDPAWEERRRREEEAERKRREEKAAREDEKRKAKSGKEAERLKREEDARKAKMRGKRKPFNFEQEKPQILASIATASQASSNLVNAITLVNTEQDSIITNERVQDCLGKAKQSRKQIVRYVQLVENEELIGTLIETNERIIAALEMYDTLSKPTVTEKDVTDVQEGLARANIHDSELGKLQEKQRAAVQRAVRSGGATGSISRGTSGRGKDRDEYAPYEHPDLHDISFGSLGPTGGNLPPPIRPTARRTSSDDEEGDYDHRGSLSDFSDHESSDEETHNRRSLGAAPTAGSSSGAYRSRSLSSSHPRAYANVSDGEDDVRADTRKGLMAQDDDPFADPFAD